MRKLIFMSVVVLPLILAMRASTDGNARRGLRRTVLWSLAFTVLWSLLAPWLASHTDYPALDPKRRPTGTSAPVAAP
jgi:hypothetical protein